MHDHAHPGAISSGRALTLAFAAVEAVGGVDWLARPCSATPATWSRTLQPSAHVLVDDLLAWPRLLAEMRELLYDRFGIEHVTLQPEPFQHVIRPMVRPRPVQ